MDKNILLPVENYQMFMVKKNGSINVSEKTTPKIKSVVEEPNSQLVFLPSRAEHPDSESRMVFLFFGNASKAKADLNNRIGGTKALNDAKVYRMCETMCSQLSLHFNDSKMLLPDYIADFSFPSVVAMKSILYLARDKTLEGRILSDIATGKFVHDKVVYFGYTIH